MQKTLVAYFNDNGDVKQIAERIADAAEGEIFEIIPAQPYTAEDLDWSGQDSRSYLETNDDAARPEVSSKVEDMDSYGLIFVGFPIWGYVEPRIVDTFLESYDLSSKHIVPFSTLGVTQATERIKELCPDADVRAGRKFTTTDNDANLYQWIAPLIHLK